jgi:phage-related minor tail protein
VNVVEVAIESIDNTRAGFESAEDNASGLGKTIGASMAVGVAALAGVGLAAAALGQQLFKAMDIEAGTDKMAAQLGLMPAASEKYGRLAGELYSGAYGEGLEDVNDALVQVTRNISGMADATEEELKGATATAMDFAAVFDEDVSEATRAAGILIKNGLAKDAKEAFDILTVGMQTGANAGDDLLDTFSEYSPLFAKLGLSGQQALGMISQSMQAGARDSDFAADAIKEFSIRAIDGSELSSKAFRDLGMNADKMRATFAKGGPESAAAMDLVMDKLREMKDPAKQAEVATALFGTKAEDLSATLMAMDPSEAVATMGEVAGAADHMSSVLADNAATKLESFKRTVETNVSNFIGQEVLPKIVELAEKAAPALTTFKDKAVEAFAWVEGKPEAINAAATAIGVGLVGAFMALSVAAWTAAGGVIAATWPILAIGAALAGLVAIVTYAWNNWDTFRNAVLSVAATLQSVLGPALIYIQEQAKLLYENCMKPLIDYITDHSEAFSNLGKVLLVLGAIIVGVVVVAIVAVIAALAAAATVLAIVALGVVALIAVLYNFAQVLWDVLGNVRDWAGGVVDKVENVIQVFWDMAKNVGSAIADSVRFFADLSSRIRNAVGDLGGLLFNAGKETIQGLIRGIESAFGALKSKLGEVTNLIPSWKGPKAKDQRLLRPTGGWIMEGLISGVQRKVPTLKGVLNDVTASIPGAAGQARSGAVEAAARAAGQTHNWYIQGSIRSDRDLVRIVRDEFTQLGLVPIQPRN